jgi:hypothetical protein
MSTSMIGAGLASTACRFGLCGQEEEPPERPFPGQDACGDELMSAVDLASGSDHTVDAAADVADLPLGHLLNG